MIKDAMTYKCKAFVFLSSRATDASALLLQVRPLSRPSLGPI